MYDACSHPRFLHQIEERAVATGVPHINLGILSKFRIPDLARGAQAAISRALGPSTTRLPLTGRLLAAVASSHVPFGNRPPGKKRRYLAPRPSSTAAHSRRGRQQLGASSFGSRSSTRVWEHLTVRNNIEVADDHVTRPGDLLFLWSGSLTAARWYRPNAIINQHIFKVAGPRLPQHRREVVVGVDDQLRDQVFATGEVAVDRARDEVELANSRRAPLATRAGQRRA